MDSIPQRHSRSLSVKTANGSCVSLLNDDLSCDSRRCSSVPELTPQHSPAPYSSCMHSPTRLPSLSALIEAVNIVSPRPAIYPTYSTSTSPTMSSQCCDQPTQKPPAKRKYRCSFPGCEKAFTT
ncbi:hypothetical protein DL89DRAFT_320410 [Linderina pennispora]|uniref:Uncharacterized protein n=1 Tax=Linderina pennispora TaxID=61395 RepID=A0A1Y1WNA2_9FUNG|nr:uncharacterized protein DL89DRAFT_320410 [Linderina pennispora]ORX75031.1 hypothetical protein DL89DRAFT_320410 [Linderina pennispora]